MYSCSDVVEGDSRGLLCWTVTVRSIYRLLLVERLKHDNQTLSRTAKCSVLQAHRTQSSIVSRLTRGSWTNSVDAGGVHTTSESACVLSENGP